MHWEFAWLLVMAATGVAIRPPKSETVRDVFGIASFKEAMPLALILWSFAGVMAALIFWG
jgi:hypothetical protein